MGSTIKMLKVWKIKRNIMEWNNFHMTWSTFAKPQAQNAYHAHTRTSVTHSSRKNCCDCKLFALSAPTQPANTVQSKMQIHSTTIEQIFHCVKENEKNKKQNKIKNKLLLCIFLACSCISFNFDCFCCYFCGWQAVQTQKKKLKTI